VDQAVKAEIKNEFKRSEQDTGSADVQVALLTSRIKELTEHLKLHKKDHSSRRGLIMMVNKRRKLLSYVQKEDDARYKELIAKLGLRR
jgi:small subunit ribosomal protein S15